MKKQQFFLTTAIICVFITSFIACEDDFSALQSDVINNNNASNFDVINEQYEIISYTQELGPVQTNGLDVNSLGQYTDVYGTTTASFLSQLELSATTPDFSDLTELDSVILYIPYFLRSIDIDENDDFTYETDSVFNVNSKLKLSLYESNFFLRDFDPNNDFDDPQAYYSNKTASSLSESLESALMSTPINLVNAYETSYNPNATNNTIDISNSGFSLQEPDNDDEDNLPQDTQQLSPGIRLKLDNDYWLNKLVGTDANPIDATSLSSQDNFNNYFRGLYFKAESASSNQTSGYAIFNAANTNANITLYYKRTTPSEDDEENTTESASYVFSFGPTRINFFDNNFNLPIAPSDQVNGDSRIYLKGGEGYTAKIKLFDGDDIDNDNNEDGVNRFEEWKAQFVETDENGDLEIKRLVNEANLVFYVDQEQVNSNEPERLYIFDAENNTPLVDYLVDATNGVFPLLSKNNHLVPLQYVDDDTEGQGEKYKIRITNHINNLLFRDSTNVELGLGVSLNVNTENPSSNFSQRKVQGTDILVPMSSVTSPKGTVLHGNSTEDENNKVYLEIYYTQPN